VVASGAAVGVALVPQPAAVSRTAAANAKTSNRITMFFMIYSLEKCLIAMHPIIPNTSEENLNFAC
jgi:hypothetical protein